jgi:hypothetical protein
MENKGKREDSYKSMLSQQLSHMMTASYSESELFDKSILTLAGGVFGLSLTFIKQIPHAGFISLLCLSWFFYVLSILLTLISMLISQSAITNYIEYLENEILNSKAENQYQNSLACCVRCLNILSITCFVAGSILLSISVTLNL